MYYRARYYNSAIGKFISEDPIRFDAGINFYSYVLNSPSMYGDPSGLHILPTPLPPDMEPPGHPPPPQPSCPPGKDCDKYGKGSWFSRQLYKICMGRPDSCWDNCVRKCLLGRYGGHGTLRYLVIDHPICFYICPNTCPMFV